MRGVSRASNAAARERLETLLSDQGVDPGVVGDELFAVTALLAGNPSLRRALTDPSRPAEAKAALVQRLLEGKVSGAVLDLLSDLGRSRWSASGDLTDAVESLAVTAILISAERAGRLEALEDELFRFARIVGGDIRLRDAMSRRTEGAARKADLVQALLGGKATPETVRLAAQAASHPRGLRSERVLEVYVEAAAARRQETVAHVVTAVPLTESQHDRLSGALERIYGRHMRLNIDIEPSVLGGLRVRVGGEVVDSTVLARIDEVRRRLAG